MAVFSLAAQIYNAIVTNGRFLNMCSAGR